MTSMGFVNMPGGGVLEKPCYRQPLGQSCPVSGTELFLVGNPTCRERLNTDTEMLRLHFRSAFGSSTEEGGYGGTD